MPTSDAAPAALLARRYRLIDRLGQGAMGEVWRAHDEHAAREVALKRITHPRADLELLKGEFRVAVELRHPHIVETLDFHAAGAAGEPGERAHAAPREAFLTMELLSARPFDAAARGAEPAAVMRLVAQVLDALVFLEGRGLVHGDLKPSNVLVDGAGHAKLVDFGMAVPGDGGGLSGTPAYLAPEVVRGGAKDTRADLYALGVIAYESLTGANPFAADDVVRCLQLQLEHLPPPLHRARADVGLALGGFVDRLLQKDPRRRSDSARAAADALAGLLADDLMAAARGPRAVVATPPLVGRDEAMAAIDRAIAAHVPGGVTRLAIVGALRSGRTRLAELAKVRGQLAGLGDDALIISDGGPPPPDAIVIGARALDPAELGQVFAAALGGAVDDEALVRPVHRAASGLVGQALRLLRELAHADALRQAGGR
ncbi:MAG: serine/threonine-protein kinase [Myxococcota bacterium]